MTSLHNTNEFISAIASVDTISGDQTAYIMQVTDTVYNLLCITGDTTDESAVRNTLGLDDSSLPFSVTTSNTVDTVTATQDAFDCILISSAMDVPSVEETIKRVRNSNESIPIIVFSDRGPSGITRLLEYDAVEVIQFTADETPPALLERRITNITEASPSHATEEKARHRIICNALETVTFELDPRGYLVSVNDAASELLEYNRSDLIGSHVTEYIDTDGIEAGKEQITELLEEEQGTYRTVQVDLETKSGYVVPCELRIGIFRDSDELTGLFGIGREINERQFNKQQLEERDEKLRHLSNNLTDVVWMYSPENGIEFVSDAYEEIWGQLPAELGENPDAFIETVHPADRDRVRSAFERKDENPDSYDEIYRVVQPDGEIRWVHDNGFGIYENGELQRIVGIAKDITALKDREKELARHRDFLAKAQQMVSFGSWEIDFAGETVNWTDEIYSIHEKSPEYEPTLEEAISFIHPEERDTLREAIETLRTEGTSYDFEVRLITANDRVKWVRTGGEPIYEDGEIVGARGVMQEIQDRKQNEQKLQAERDLIERIFETSPVGIVVHDADGKIIRVNEQAGELLGVDISTLIDLSTRPESFKMYDTDGTKLATEDIPSARVRDTEQPIWNEEIIIERPSGEQIYLSINGVPLFDDGELARTVVTFDDITDRVYRERRLKIQRNRLAQLDRINRIIRTIDEALVGATSREEIEQAVCTNLSKSGRYRHTHLVRAVGESSLELRAIDDNHSKAVGELFSVDANKIASAAELEAIQTGETQMITADQSSSEFLTVDCIDSVATTGIGAIAAIPLSYENEQYGCVVVSLHPDDSFSQRELDVLDELGETVGHAIAAIESQAREATLTALYETTEDLLTAESATAVSEVVVQTASDVLEPTAIGMYLIDKTATALRPEAVTDELLQFHDEDTRFGPGEGSSVMWDAYISGDKRLVTNIRESHPNAVVDAENYSTFVIPLGDHGVFVVADSNPVAFESGKLQIIELLAAKTESALDRVAGETGIQKLDTELSKRTARIETFERMISMVFDIDEILQTADTREELETGVCERLVECETFSFAWIGTVHPNDTAMTPQAWAGIEDGYLDGISLDLSGTVPSIESARTGEKTLVKNITDHLRSDQWAREAIDRDYQSALAIPIRNQGIEYGVLTVFANQPNAFDETIVDMISEVGNTIAYGLNNIETKQALLAESVTEMELKVDTPETFFNAIAEETGDKLHYQEIGSDRDEGVHVLFSLRHAPVETIQKLQSQFVAVESVTHEKRGDVYLFRATLSGPTIAATLLQCGSIPHTVIADVEETRATVHIPQDLDIDIFLDRLREYYPDIELLFRDETTWNGKTNSPHPFELESELTDRQFEVLQTAYANGYFQSPREITGAELADRLEIAQPTVTHHLRNAQDRLLRNVFAEE